MSYRCEVCRIAFDGSMRNGTVLDPRPVRVVSSYRVAMYERDHLDRPMNTRFGHEVAKEKLVCKECAPKVEAKPPARAGEEVAA